MGFLEAGDPVPWSDSLEFLAYVREHGVAQFLQIYEKVKGVQNEDLLWGDEVEYGVLKINKEEGTVKLSLRGAEILKELQTKEETLSHPDQRYERCHWVPEYGAWMVEATPEVPYAGFAADLLRVERSMKTRRARLIAALKPDEICPTVPCFPMMGVGTFTEPAHPPGGPAAQSLFVPDALINPHPRFPTLTANIRQRRGRKVDIRLPRFHDTKTPQGVAGLKAPETLEEALKMEEVYMDAMAFGMGCCCLQVTFQACDIGESRHLYDQLAVLSPVLLALTAATPIARGTLVDTDVRWDIIAGSVDDRTPAECPTCPQRTSSSGTRQGGAAGGGGEAAASSSSSSSVVYHENMAGSGQRVLPKSRYDSISHYICDHLEGRDAGSATAQFNDTDAPYDEKAYAQLRASGVDDVLAQHIAHLFVRDPLVMFHGKVTELDDTVATDHFESLQSTNWQTVRWKPPPPSSSHLGGSVPIGWRVEFRSMEVQLTDFENAAFTAFIVLASRVVLFFNLNLYVPISKVDENMRRAHARDALKTQKFYFRQATFKHDVAGADDASERDSFRGDDFVAAAAAMPKPPPSPALSATPGAFSGIPNLAALGTGEAMSRNNSFGMGGRRGEKATAQERLRCCSEGAYHTCEMSVAEILSGKGDYRGLVPMIMAYLELIGTDSDTMKTMVTYMDFICARASGELLTPAQWMRNFVRSHAEYKHDSVVSERIATDLMVACHRIGTGLRHEPSLHGSFKVGTVSAKDAYAAALGSKPHDAGVKRGEVKANLDKYSQRAELQTKRRRLQSDIETLHAQMKAKEGELAGVNASIADTLE